MTNHLAQDIRYGIRLLTKSPLFTIVAVVTLALGIGANTAIFSVVDGVLLRPLPYKNPERLALIRMSFTEQEFLPSISPAELFDFRERATYFEGFDGTWFITQALTGPGGEPEQILGALVTPGMFDLLGVQPALGRGFTPEDGVPNAAPVAVLGHELWQRRFGGDRSILDKVITLNGQSVAVVGVMPPGYGLLLPRDSGAHAVYDVFLPFQFAQANAPREPHFLRVIGRLKEGATWEQAQAQMDGIARDLVKEHPFYKTSGLSLFAVPLHEDLVRKVSPVMPVLLGAVGFLLLIASANVASLMLARGLVREKEIAIRAALGAGRKRIVRQLITESALIATLGGATGVLLAGWTLNAVLAFAPSDLPRIDQIGVNARVLFFSLGITALTALLCGLAPALQISRADLSESLKEGGRTGASALPNKLRSALVVTEVALSLVLLTGAGLMIRSVLSLQRVDSGFRPEGVTTFQLSLPFQKYGDMEKTGRFHRQLQERLAARAGIEAVGSVFPFPLSGRFWTAEFAWDAETERTWGSIACDQHVVLPGTFEAVGTRLVAGRTFTWDDYAPDRKVTVIDEKMARRAFPGENPVGRKIQLAVGNNEREWLEVIGVVAHVRQEHPGSESREQLYILPALVPLWDAPMAVRSTMAQGPLMDLVRSEVRALDPDLPVYRVRPMTDYVGDVMARDRFAVIMMGLFAGLAVLLTAVGLYGVIAQMVGQRSHEIGIRMALGAGRREILSMVVGRGMLLAAIGILIGVAGSLAATRLLSSLLHGVAPTDPATYAGVCVLIAGVALLATLVPARRAMRVEPVSALRYE